ncbi:winged helix-turn-helix transcriptional regulator [Streptomyces sp. NPDC056656]|uniref:winged helix-turn-helix transcriptional regulator n=1 Tax=unclassified Streptomyces TaxID=2593676 RepID=UPI000C2715ED|nr:winged helix-turn-helix transcriptional regulator [Streptomyces sp. CB01635]PJN07905.1 hypothetical protein CG723_31495 [Streptomyces sp. CB01635]
MSRKVYATVPPKVEYRATGMAVEWYSSLTDLTKWAERRREAIADSREAYDREHGRPAETTLTTEHRP